MGGDEEMPREAFQRLRDSSFWSDRADVRSYVPSSASYCEKTEGRLQEKRGGVCLREISHMDPAKRSSTS